MATKRIEKAPTPPFETFEVCDRCGDIAMQDNLLRPGTVLGGIHLVAHHDCWYQIENEVRQRLGLKPSEGAA